AAPAPAPGAGDTGVIGAVHAGAGPVPGTRRARRLAEEAAREGRPGGVAVEERSRWDTGPGVRHTEDHDEPGGRHSGPGSPGVRYDDAGHDRYDEYAPAGHDSYAGGDDRSWHAGHDAPAGYDGYEDYGYEDLGHDVATADEAMYGYQADPGAARGSTRVSAAPRRRGRKALVFVLVLGLIGLGGYVALVGLRPMVEEVRALFAPPADFPGPATGEVTVTVPEGSSLRAIGDVLVEAGVVASSGAFVGAAEDNPDGGSIQAGTYTLQENMPAADAVAAMLDGDSQVRDLLTVPEGQIAARTVEAVAEYRGVPVQEAQAALQQVTLPASADGDPEGFLFPDSYEFPADDTLVQIFQAMVDRGGEERAALGIPADREREIVIEASIAEAEGRQQDFGNIASVIDNRLAGEVPRTNGTLGMDSTCRYLRLRDGLPLAECLDDPANPWNTRANPGLPPGPINSPGTAALQAATSPPDTDFGYFVTIDLNTRETLFTASYDEFLDYRDQFQDWCDANNRPEGC
ncbi:MAG: endolytic transglycosylase MltG, partial [Kineosporiaceae bacterium]